MTHVSHNGAQAGGTPGAWPILVEMLLKTAAANVWKMLSVGDSRQCFSASSSTGKPVVLAIPVLPYCRDDCDSPSGPLHAAPPSSSLGHLQSIGHAYASGPCMWGV